MINETIEALICRKKLPWRKGLRLSHFPGGRIYLCGVGKQKPFVNLLRKNGLLPNPKQKIWRFSSVKEFFQEMNLPENLSGEDMILAFIYYRAKNKDISLEEVREIALPLIEQDRIAAAQMRMLEQPSIDRAKATKKAGIIQSFNDLMH